MKCKNVDCSNEYASKNLYCSQSCRSYYVNKYVRDYTKLRKHGANRRKLAEQEYLKSPNFCKNCENIIPYGSHGKVFCGHSCSASYTNKDRVGTKHTLSPNGLEALKESGKRLSLLGLNQYSTKEYHLLLREYESNPKHCLQCDQVFDFKHRLRKYCSRICRSNYENANRDEYLEYKRKTNFKFSLNKFPNEFDFSLIEKYGWYSASNSTNPNLNGVSRDHLYSVSQGFKDKVNPELLAHPANCRLMVHSDNISKGFKCNITLSALQEKIKCWEEKYGGACT